LGWQTLSAQAVSVTVGHVTIDAGLGSQVPLDLLQNISPLHVLPSSSLLQSAVVLHEHVLVPPLHAPPLQMSPVVHLSPSSQAVFAAAAVISHSPVDGMHAALRQAVFLSVGHLTVSAGLIRHFLVFLSQNSALQSVSSVQSASTEQEHVSMPVHWAFPPFAEVHRSFSVHELPSSHSVPVGLLVIVHLPVLLSQPASVHASLEAAQTTLVPGLMRQDHGSTALSQKKVPVHASPSVLQSALCWHSQPLTVPAVHDPLAQRSPMLHGLPSSHGVPFGRGTMEQLPSASHRFVAQGVSLAGSHQQEGVLVTSTATLSELTGSASSEHAAARAINATTPARC